MKYFMESDVGQKFKTSGTVLLTLIWSWAGHLARRDVGVKP